MADQILQQLQGLNPLLAIPTTIVGALILILLKTRPSSQISRIPAIPFWDAISLIRQTITFEEYAERYDYYIKQPLSRLFFAGNWLIIAAKPSHARAILTQHNQFRKRSGDNIISHGMHFTFFGRNVVGQNGELWQRLRRANAPAYNKLFPTTTFRELTAEMLIEWDKDVVQGKAIEVTDWMSKLTLDVLGRSIFDVEFMALKPQGTRLLELYRYLMEGFFNLKYFALPFFDKRWWPWRRPYFLAVDEMNAYFMGIIAEKKALVETRMMQGGETSSKNDKDLLTLLLETRYTENEQDALTDEELRANAAVTFVAGHDTTSTALTAIIYYLGKYPEIQEKVRKEVLDSLPTDEAITPKTKLPYLEAVINETMRIHPPVSLLPFRNVVQDTEFEMVGGSSLTVPAGAMITLDIKSMQRNPEYWQNPNEFRPERWLEEDKEGKRRNAFWPFGGGARICLGMQFSLLEQRVVMSMLLRRYEWTLPKDNVHGDDVKVSGLAVLSKPLPIHAVFSHVPT